MVAINWTNITSFAQIPQAANTTTGGYFWVGTLYMIWIILLILFAYFGFEVALLTSSFLALILGLLLVYTDLIAWQWCLTFVGLILGMFLYIIWSSNKVRQ